MSQHDLTIANDTRTNVRTDIQSAVQALGSTSKGNSRPATPYAGQIWIDDNTPSSSVWTVNVYDGTDDIPIGTINVSANTFTLTNAVPLAGSGGVGGSYYYTGQVLWGQNSTTVPGSSNTTTGAAIGADGTAHFSTAGLYALLLNRNSDGTLAAFGRAGTGGGSISISGSTVSYNTTSDYRLKFDVDDDVLPAAEAIVRAARPVKHRWVRDPSGPLAWGFLAHEVAELVPQAVTGAKDAMNGEEIAPQQMDAAKLVPVLTAALKQAFDKIDALEARIAALEAPQP